LFNDTVGMVIVKRLECNSFQEKDRLPIAPRKQRPGQHSSGDVAYWWAVTDSTGRTVGCLPLRFNYKSDGLVVNVSKHTACPVGSTRLSGDLLGAIIGFALFLFSPV
jgi:hypothetical protein